MRSRWNVWVVTIGLGWALASACHARSPAGEEARAPLPALKRRLAPSAAHRDYRGLLSDIDRRVAALSRKAQKRSDDWLTRMHLGTALLERAALTNGFDDYARVERVLDEAFAAAPPGGGPLLLAARFNFSIHRLDRAEDYLKQMEGRALKKHDEMVGARLLRADIAVERGQYAEARVALEREAASNRNVALTHLALFHGKTGAPEQAAVLLAEALAETEVIDPKRRAWLRLQLGILEMNRGRYREATAELSAADEELPGWWLVREHRAEVLTLQGKWAEAAPIYEDILRENELPQYLDPLAECYRHLGRDADADAAVARATSLWDEKMAVFPEAAMGHGLAHYLEHGAPARALEMARQNFAVRPGGEASVLLVEALLSSRRTEEALAVAEATLATPYRSADLHDVAARAHAALGNTAAAARERARCLAINPAFYAAD